MTRMFHPWERPTDRCSDGPRPGAVALLAAVLDLFGEHGASSLGIYNCRTVRGSSVPSVHGEGRAIDVGLPMTDDGQADGHQVVDRILAVAWELGACYAVYDRSDFNQWHPYGDEYGGVHPHRDHLHLELTRYAAETLNFVTAKALLEDNPMKQLAQAVVVPAQQPNLWDVPLGASIAEAYGLALVESDGSGVLRSIRSVHGPGTPVDVTDFAVVVGGQTKYPSTPKAIRIAGEDRWDTARKVAEFLQAHDPDDWRREGRPF